MNQQNKQGQDGPGMRQALNVVYVVATGWSWWLWPFMHWNMGKNAIGFRGLVAFVLGWLYAAVVPCPELVYVFPFWVGALITQRLRTAWLLGHGAVMHSYYMGDPLLPKIWPFKMTMETARNWEGGVAFLVGLGLLAVIPSLGAFVISASICSAIVMGIDQQVTDNKITAMKDAEIEQRYLSELYRGERTMY